MRRLCSVLLCLLLIASMASSVYAASPVPEPVIKATESVVRILAEYSDGYSTGSGFVVKSDRDETLIATNYHVVEGNPYSISIWLSEEETVSASILAFTNQKDMCILKLAYPVSLKPLAFAEAGAKQGDAVYAIGFPGAADYLSDKEAHTSADATITDGIVSAVREATVSSYGTPTKILQISAAINSGNSGGPLFNDKGEVVGINTYGINDSQGIFGAIDVSELTYFMAGYSISAPTPANDFPWTVFMVAVCVVIVIVATFIIVKIRKKAHKNTREDTTEGQCTPAAVKKKKPSHRIKAAVVATIILIAVVPGAYSVCYIGAKANAKDNNFDDAEKLLFVVPITELHDAKLVEYIRAGQLLENRSYGEAKKQFEMLSGYLSADEMALEAEYRHALQYADASDFEKAVTMMENLSEAGYKDSADQVLELRYRHGLYLLQEKQNYKAAGNIFSQLADSGHKGAEEMKNETVYLWAFDLIDNGSYTEAYKKFDSIQGYSDVDDCLDALTELMYLEGQELYYEEDYDEAKELFDCISSYADSKKYLTLIEVHAFAGWRDTEWTVKKLVDMFYFENTSEVLLSVSRIAEEFLRGTWLGDGHYFTMEEDGHISYDLPWIDYGDYYKIEDGQILLYPENNRNATKALFSFVAITPDCIEVYCYKDHQSYVLYRQ